MYHPNRLTLVSPCLTVSGTVESVRSEADGDTHFDLAVDAQFVDLLKPANNSAQHGWLVAEIVPADKPGCRPGQAPRPTLGSYDYGLCTGADESNPPLGAHVWVTGPYVLDQAHEGWAEIHPVWAVSARAPSPRAGTQSPPAAGSAPPAAPTPSGPAASEPQAQILSVTSPVRRGSEASLVAQVGPGETCDLAVTLPSGARSQSQGLGPETADTGGRLRWSWRTGSRTTPGTATATVTCAASTTSAQFEITS